MPEAMMLPSKYAEAMVRLMYTLELQTTESLQSISDALKKYGYGENDLYSSNGITMTEYDKSVNFVLEERKNNAGHGSEELSE
jgi:dissimilatory sulfite reductase (desulfoviridin) alpha/beta subunit